MLSNNKPCLNNIKKVKIILFTSILQKLLSVIPSAFLLVVYEVEDALLHLALKHVLKNRLLLPTFIPLLVLGPSTSLHALSKVVN